MKTKALFMGHPIHPMIIPFPIAFFIGAFVCDVVGRLADSTGWWKSGAGLALGGILTGVLAAVPGLIDYLLSVPPNSSGKVRATRHMLSNLSAVVLFVIAWILRQGYSTPPTATVLIVEALGVAMVSIGGWLGGTLVYKNLVGPEHLYAGGAKWSEGSYEANSGKPIVVARADELKPDQMKLIRVNDLRIVLTRTEAGYRAFDDHCTHQGASLADGVVLCGNCQCLWHGSRFDVSTGAVKSGPAKESISTYKVEQVGEEIRLLL